jgi:hypothetical protein
MEIALSRNGVRVRLTEERWMHIVSRHPEMAEYRNRVMETVATPDYVQQGDSGELLAVRDYGEGPKPGRLVVVVYREAAPDDGFILTAYVAERTSSRRKILWKR